MAHVHAGSIYLGRLCPHPLPPAYIQALEEVPGELTSCALIAGAHGQQPLMMTSGSQGHALSLQSGHASFFSASSGAQALEAPLGSLQVRQALCDAAMIVRRGMSRALGVPLGSLHV